MNTGAIFVISREHIAQSKTRLQVSNGFEVSAKTDAEAGRKTFPITAAIEHDRIFEGNWLKLDH